MASSKTKLKSAETSWQIINKTLLVFKSAHVTEHVLSSITSIRAFDMDGTWIRTKSGRIYPTNAQDWVWWHNDVPDLLRQEAANSKQLVVIFSNQHGCSKVAKRLEIQQKVEDLAKILGIPMMVLIATSDDWYRKPSTHMWTHLMDHVVKWSTADQEKRRTQCIFVGDAAGRHASWDGRAKTKADFACSDRLFAYNIGLLFYTPEEYFLHYKPVSETQWSWPATVSNAIAAHGVILADETVSVDTSSVTSSASSTVAAITPHGLPVETRQELVIFVGMPASGKSTLARKEFGEKGYILINRDTLKTVQRCVRAMVVAIQHGNSTAIDNTNPSQEARAKFIHAAREYAPDIIIRCIWMQTPEATCHELNQRREEETNGAIKRVPRIAYNIFKGKFEEPVIDEGFTTILRIPFVLTK